MAQGSRQGGGGSRRKLGGALSCALVALTASPLAAEVVVEHRPDGTRMVRNSAPVPSPTLTVREPSPLPSRTGHASPVLSARRPNEEALRRLVLTAAEREGVDVRLVEAVVRAESAWNPGALSVKGAIGLMQLMPATAAELAVVDPWDAAQNIGGGVRYLRQLLDRFDRLEHVVAAYNAGPGAVERHGGVPPYRETREYVRRVLADYDGREPDFRSEGPTPRLMRTGDGRRVLTNAPGDTSKVSHRTAPRRPGLPAGAISITLAAR